MEKTLVTVLTPCYNGEKYLVRYFESLLNQTYRKLQLIFVNDGSTDNSEKIALEYKNKFEKNNMEFVYLYQTNGGQASAVANGLNYVKGEFLIWPDADDYYEVNAIEEMLKVINRNKDLSYVRCGVTFRREEDLSIEKKLGPINKDKDNLFVDYIMKTKNIYCFSGVIMIRFEDFIFYNKGLKIYNSREGQNWQLILPVVYKGKGYYIEKYLYNCVVRNDSHSRNERDLNSKIKRSKDLSKILVHTIGKIKMPFFEKIKYILMVKKKYFKLEISLRLKKNIDEKNYVIDKKLCNGCMACKFICKSDAIVSITDDEGFEYPIILKDKCTSCGLCKKKCPVLNNFKEENILKSYACKNTNEKIRLSSSSGGIFDLLAKNIFENKGIVIGACFDKNMFLVHDTCEKYKEIEKFRGSKYLQSSLKDIYLKIEKELKEDRYVLFTGTPCQIGGLKAYLGKEYSKLYTQDIICHGVPSKNLFNKYKEYILGKEKIKTINFRDKSDGWNNNSIKINEYKKSNMEDPYMRLFIKNKCLRYSCYDCAFKGKNKQSDITLGDFWGIEDVLPDFNDNIGVSLVIINTKKGKEIFDLIKKDLLYKEVDFDKAIEKNEAYSVSAKEPKTRYNFYKDLDGLTFDKLYKKHYNKKKSLLKRIMRKILK